MLAVIWKILRVFYFTEGHFGRHLPQEKVYQVLSWQPWQCDFISRGISTFSDRITSPRKPTTFKAGDRAKRGKDKSQTTTIID